MKINEFLHLQRGQRLIGNIKITTKLGVPHIVYRSGDVEVDAANPKSHSLIDNDVDSLLVSQIKIFWSLRSRWMISF